MIPSGPAASAAAILAFGLTESAAQIGTDEGDDVVDRADAGEPRRDIGDPGRSACRRREQELIGVAQALDVLAAEAARASCRRC